MQAGDPGKPRPLEKTGWQSRSCSNTGSPRELKGAVNVYITKLVNESADIKRQEDASPGKEDANLDLSVSFHPVLTHDGASHTSIPWGHFLYSSLEISMAMSSS